MIQIANYVGALLLASSAFSPLAISQEPGASAEAVTLRYLPKKGDVIQHHWLGSHQLFATELLSQAEGSEIVSFDRLPSLDTKELRVTTDWIQRVEDGRIQRVRRRWSDVEVWGKLDFQIPQQKPLEVILKSPLGYPSTSVVYTYVPEENNYGVHFDQSAQVESLLAGVRLHNSCEKFLPQGAVKVGDTWDVELEHLIELMAPTGSMDYRQIKPVGGMLIRTLLMGVGGCAETVWNPKVLKGYLRCKLTKVADTGSLSFAHVELTYKFATSQDRSAAAKGLQMMGESRNGSIVLYNSVQHSGEGFGKLIWNLNQNRAHSYEWIGTEVLKMEIQTQALHQAAVTQRMTLQGTSEVKCRVSLATRNEFLRPWTLNPQEKIESTPTATGSGDESAGVGPQQEK